MLSEETLSRFNIRRQEVGEPVDSFITWLYRLAEHCNYRDLHDEMIRDRMVVSLPDSYLSERLQTDPELTLDSIRQERWLDEQKLLASSRRW